jgi:hypothetical protein
VRLGLSVRDTGSGVSQQEVAALFEPFAQADASIVRSHGGTGLGLTICKRLAELMDGTVGGEGCIGSGAHFWAKSGSGSPATKHCERFDPAWKPPRWRICVYLWSTMWRSTGSWPVTSSHAPGRGEQAENGRLAVERICAGGIRSGVDGHPDAGDGWQERDPRNHLAARRARAEDRRADGACAGRRTCRMPCARHVRISHQADRYGCTFTGSGASRERRAFGRRIDFAPEAAPPLLDVAGIASQFDEDIELYQEVLDASISDFAAMRESLVAALDGPVEALDEGRFTRSRVPA